MAVRLAHAPVRRRRHALLSDTNWRPRANRVTAAFGRRTCHTADKSSHMCRGSGRMKHPKASGRVEHPQEVEARNEIRVEKGTVKGEEAGACACVWTEAHAPERRQRTPPSEQDRSSVWLKSVSYCWQGLENVKR